MAPPPSQAGKFKPRKAVKKVAVAAPAEGGTAATNERSSSSNQGSSAGARGGGRGGRGGREARGGRGRGRFPQPQGQVFFTATPGTGVNTGSKKTLASKVKAARAANAAKSNSAIQRPGVQVKRENESQEEVVGTMEEGVGFRALNDSKVKAEGNRNDDDFELDEAPARVAAPSRKGGHGMETFEYDSDSSKEDASSSSRQKQDIVEPVALPFPKGYTSVGTGGTDRPVFYPGEGYNLPRDDKQIEPQNHTLDAVVTVDPVGMSPFVDTTNTDSLRLEKNSWFLVQLPTRLPPVQQSEDDVVPPPDSQDVRTAPVQTSCFDNSLSSAKPGRLGRMLVYKSGKTVLVLEGANGAPSVRTYASPRFDCDCDCLTGQLCSLTIHPLSLADAFECIRGPNMWLPAASSCN